MKTTKTSAAPEDRIAIGEEEIAKIHAAKEDILTALTSFSSRKRAALEASDVELVTRLNAEREVLESKKLTIEVELYKARIHLEELKALVAEEELAAAEEERSRRAAAREEAERLAKEAHGAWYVLDQTRRTAQDRAGALQRQLDDYLHQISSEAKVSEAPVVRSLPHVRAEAG